MGWIMLQVEHQYTFQRLFLGLHAEAGSRARQAEVLDCESSVGFVFLTFGQEYSAPLCSDKNSQGRGAANVGTSGSLAVFFVGKPAFCSITRRGVQFDCHLCAVT